MNHEEIRIAIAEACGWSRCYIHRQEGLRDEAYGLPPNALPVSENYCHLPDYLNDLNAMHEAENACIFGDFRGDLGIRHRSQVFTRSLALVMDRDTGHKYSPDWPNCDSYCAYCVLYLMQATAAQRAEAFLKTLNLWKP